MADSYHIIDGQVVPFHGGRKDTNTGAWRDATPMELQLQAELCAAERALEEAAAALEAAREDACVNSAMVERALSHKAFCEDGASWPDAYSEDEQRIERDAMAALIAAALRSGGPAAYCRACQWAGMSNCAHFDECSGATCITCHRPLNQAIDQARGKGVA